MKAVVCTDGGVQVTETADPEPGPGEVVVAVDACGLCGSDVHALERGGTADGQILGHEFAGTIAETGAGVTRWRAGDTVAVNPIGSCGRCRLCVKAVPFRCAAKPNLGITAPGGFAQYVAAGEDQLVRLPPGLPAELGAHAEPLAVALAAVGQAAPGPGDVSLVYGVGSIGLNVIIALRLAGAGPIIAAGRSPGRRAAAGMLGAAEVIDTRETGVVDYAKRANLRFAAVFECSGAPGAIGEALDVVEPGGTCVEVALTPEVARVPLGRMVGDGLRLSGSCAFTPEIYETAVGHIAAGRAPVTKLISERVALERTPDALVRLRRPGELVRVLVKPWG